MPTTKPIHGSARSLSPAAAGRLGGWGVIALCASILGYVAWMAIQTLQTPPTPTAIASAAPTAAATIPALQLNTAHARQGAPVAAPIPGTGRSNPFLP